MTKKNILIFAALIIVLIAGTLVVDLKRSSKQQLLQPSSVDAYASVAVDMDLDEYLVSTKEILTGKAPLLVIISPNQTPQGQPTIHVIGGLAELAKLNTKQNKTINQFDAVYPTLALAYLPKQKTFSFFSQKVEKIHLVPLNTAGIRGILFDEDWNWVKEQDVSHPNFAETTVFALMADNSKRPLAEVKIPFSVIRDIQDLTQK
jgi:hypothetical protein